MPYYLASTGTVPAFFVLLTLILTSVVVISLILVRFRQSLLVGYFLCGLVLSNSGILHWAGADSSELIHALSEIGIILLLFTLGIEFSVSELKNLRRPAFLGGSIQVGLCTLIGTGIATLAGLDPRHAIVVGFAVALSSTAVSIKSFQDLRQPDTPQGRVALGMVLFQDLAVILFIVLLPAILDTGGNPIIVLSLALLKGAAFCVGAILLSKYGIPQMLSAVALTRSRELFTVTVVGLCSAIAVISGLLGLSPALGAFAAGVVVSGSIYSHRVLADVLPLKDLFLTLFFVSIGLLIDLDSIIAHWQLIVCGTLLIILLKGMIVAFAARVSGLRMGDWIITAAALSSTGEFSIVLLNRAAELGALSPVVEQVLLVCTAVTMGAVPSLMKLSLGIAKKIRSASGSPLLTRSDRHLGVAGKMNDLSDHVIICGYGPVGKALHENLRKANVGVIVIEMNPQTVKKLLHEGTVCIFADAGQEVALHLARIEHARAIAYTFPHKSVVLGALPTIRRMNTSILIFARTKFGIEADELLQAGVNHVLHDEEESGRAMIRSVMNCYPFMLEED